MHVDLGEALELFLSLQSRANALSGRYPQFGSLMRIFTTSARFINKLSWPEGGFSLGKDELPTFFSGHNLSNRV